MDTILTVVLVLACIAMISLSAALIYDLSREYIEDQRAAKRRDELIEKWSKLDLTHEQVIDQAEQFALWVAREIFDDNWEFNTDSFAEIACRKLANLGIVQAKGNVWELVDNYEREG